MFDSLQHSAVGPIGGWLGVDVPRVRRVFEFEPIDFENVLP